MTHHNLRPGSRRIPDRKARPIAANDHGQTGSLLHMAGPQEAVADDPMHRVEADMSDERRQRRRARSRRRIIRWTVGATAAALLLVTVPLLLRDDSIAQPQVQVLATIEVLTGTARLMSSAEHPTEPALLQVGDSVRAGDGVDTTKGGLAALRLAGGASVRIGRDTRLRLQSYSSMTLEEGTIYIDSGEGGLDRSVEVHTPLGVARDIGTRFEVRLDGSGLRIRVRDGLVRLAQGNASHLLNVGDELTLDQKGTVARRTVPLYGADWSWAAALGRPFDVEGRSLHQFVDWVAGENGWQVRFANPVVEQKSHATTLHGSIQGRTVQEALSALLPAGGVAHRLENGVLRIVDAGADKD